MLKLFIKVLYASLLSLALTVQAESTRDWRSSKAFYVDSFGLVQDDQLRSNAQSVFDRLLNVVDNIKAKDPQLYVVDSKGWPWAIALPDNSIILSKGALEVCYEGVSKATGDVRLAMIVGHELSHLAEDDYWYRDTYVALSQDKTIKDKPVFSFIASRSGLAGKDKDWINSVRDREIRADDKGFLYAALAGYDVSQLIKDNENFFEYWKSRTQLEGARTHASAEDRAAFIAARLQDLNGLVDAYQLGLVLVHFDYLDEAETVYRYMLDKMPAAEVYNNLGYLNFVRSGVQSINRRHDSYWLPSMLDTSPKTKILTRGMISSQNNNAALEKAADYFKTAIELRPDYALAKMNLAATYFYQQKYEAAIAILKEIQSGQVNSSALESMVVLAQYMSLKDSIDMTQVTIEKLTKLHETNQDSAYLTYNLALLLTQSGNKKQAEQHWNHLAKTTVLPAQYAAVASKYASVDIKNIEDFPMHSMQALSKPSTDPSVETPTKYVLFTSNDGLKITKHVFKEFVEYSANETRLFRQYVNIPSNTIAQLNAKIKENDYLGFPNQYSVVAVNDKDKILYQSDKQYVFLK